MPFTSGNCRTLNEFLEEMITLATANGWALLRGASSLGDSGEFPITARYLRITFSNPQATPSIVAGLGIRETAGGANLTLDAAQLSASGWNDGFPPENVLDGLSTTWWDGDPEGNAQLIYDFITPQAVRQVTLRAPSPTATGMPRTISFARSDDRINWDTFYTAPTVALWTAGETKLFTFPADGTNTLAASPTGGVRRPVEFWLQGPGYDEDRRVILGFRTQYDLVTGYGTIQMNGAISFDATRVWLGMENSIPSDYPEFVVDNSGEDLDYWIYVNSTRIIGAVKATAADYALFYSGFMAAFGNPDQYPFPLYIAGTTTESLGLAPNSSSPSNANFWDPGFVSAKILDMNGDWQTVNNQQNSGSTVRPLGVADYFVAPWHTGVANGSGMFDSLSGDTDGGNNHLFISLGPTDQDDLPTLSAIVTARVDGPLGALQGVIAIPGASVLSPETVITIGADDYRIFPNRTRRLGNAWVGIQE